MKVRDLIKIIYDRQEVKIYDFITLNFCDIGEDLDCEKCTHYESEETKCKYLLEHSNERILFSGYCDEVPIKLADFSVMEISVKEEGKGCRRKQIIEIIAD